MKYCLFVYVDVDICLVSFRIERFTDGSAMPQHFSTTRLLLLTTNRKVFVRL
jgi:hypothetical protein